MRAVMQYTYLTNNKVKRIFNMENIHNMLVEKRHKITLKL